MLRDRWLKDDTHGEDDKEWILQNLGWRPPPKTFLQMMIPQYVPPSPAIARSPLQSRFLAAHHLWYLLVKDYTLRFLTKSTDKLPALSGLAIVFQAEFGSGSKYIAGIWTGDIINGLAWQRTSVSESHKQGYANANSRPYRAPSFSWAASDDPVCFRAEGDQSEVNRSDYEARAVILRSHPIRLEHSWANIKCAYHTPYVCHSISRREGQVWRFLVVSGIRLR